MQYVEKGSKEIDCSKTQRSWGLELTSFNLNRRCVPILFSRIYVQRKVFDCITYHTSFIKNVLHWEFIIMCKIHEGILNIVITCNVM